MNLNDWINSHPQPERKLLREKLAAKLDCSEVYVRSMANGNRPIPPEYVLTISDFTAGKVAPGDLRPDLYPAGFMKKARSA